jgi:hypothetical protein
MRVERLWIVPAVTIWIAVSAHRPFDLSPPGIAILAAALLIGALGGWRAARAALVSVDVPGRSLVISSGKSALLCAIALGAITLLLTNLFYSQMLPLTNAGLLMGVGSVSANRLYFLSAWLRARRQPPEPAALSRGAGQ